MYQVVKYNSDEMVITGNIIHLYQGIIDNILRDPQYIIWRLVEF